MIQATRRAMREARTHALEAQIAALKQENERLREALTPFAEFAAKIEKERPGWYHDQFSFMHSISGEYDIPMKWMIGALLALHELDRE